MPENKLTSYETMNEEMLLEKNKSAIAGETERAARASIRLDKREYPHRKHTEIISPNAQSFELMGTLDEQEQQELYKQTQLKKIGKTILGEGKFGRVRLVKTTNGENSGTYFAVKKIKQDILVFARENIFHQKCMQYHLPNIMLSIDAVKLQDSKGQEAFYQIMPIANSGDGNDVIANMSVLDDHDKNTLFNFLSLSLIKSFAELNAHGIYHRDFKPDNFLIDIKNDDVNVYISDFGSAVIRENDHDYFEVSSQTAIIYWSPEMYHLQEMRFPSMTAFYQAIDSWRLGLSLMQLISPEANQYVYNHLLKEPNQLPPTYNEKKLYYFEQHNDMMNLFNKYQVSLEMQQIILGLLNPNPLQRLTINDAYQVVATTQKPDKQIIVALFTRMHLQEKNTALDSNQISQDQYKLMNETNVRYEKINQEPEVQYGKINQEPDVQYGKIGQEPDVQYGKINQDPIMQYGKIGQEPAVQYGKINQEPAVQYGKINQEPAVQYGKINQMLPVVEENVKCDLSRYEEAMHRAFNNLVTYSMKKQKDTLDSLRKNAIQTIIKELTTNDLLSERNVQNNKLTIKALTARLDYFEKVMEEVDILSKHHTFSTKTSTDTTSLTLFKELHTHTFQLLKQQKILLSDQIEHYQYDIDHDIHHHKHRSLSFVANVFNELLNKVKTINKKENDIMADANEQQDHHKKLEI